MFSQQSLEFLYRIGPIGKSLNLQEKRESNPFVRVNQPGRDVNIPQLSLRRLKRA
jgi:hypothetical protein